MYRSTRESQIDSRVPPTSGLALAVLMGIAFTLLCSLRVAGDSSGVLGGNVVLRSVLKGPLWATQLARNVMVLALVHIALSTLLGVTCWLLARLSEIAWPGAAVSRKKWVLCWFILMTAWILVSNAAHYPWSALGEPYAVLVEQSWHGLNANRGANVIAALALASTILIGLLRIAQRFPKPKKLVVAASCAIALGVLVDCNN